MSRQGGPSVLLAFKRLLLTTLRALPFFPGVGEGALPCLGPLLTFAGLMTMMMTLMILTAFPLTAEPYLCRAYLTFAGLILQHPS